MNGAINSYKLTHGLLHGDLCDWWEVVVGVLAHADPAEKDRHDSWQMDALGQRVGDVDEAQHQGELQRRVAVQVDKLKQQGAGKIIRHRRSYIKKVIQEIALNTTLHSR